jgi:hypothetical protein
MNPQHNGTAADPQTLAPIIPPSARNDRLEPLPRDPLGQRLCETFPYFWQAILGVNEPDPNWQTLTPYPLRPRVLWKLWQDAAQLVGVRFGHSTRYALLDIDATSPYHPAQGTQALPLIRAALETIGIDRSILLRSSWSGGLHLYLPLPDEVPTFGLACALKQCLEAQGLLVTQGKLEIFPNCKTYAKPGTYTEYNAHRLPLQPASGSCLLDDDGNPIGEDLGQLFQQWDVAAAGQDLEELRQAIATARMNRRKRSRQRGIVADWQADLETEMEQGWTGYGQTNHLLKTIACYGVVFGGLRGEALAEFVEQRAMSSPGYGQWCRHQSEIRLRSQVWARAAEGYYWQLGDQPKRLGAFHGEAENNIVPFNQARSQEAQERIRQAMHQLTAEGTLPPTPTARATAIATVGSVSLKTLYRHLELWHPEHWFPDQSKIPVCETVLAVAVIDPGGGADPPEQAKGGEFYTSEDFMKGKAFLLDSFRSTPSYPDLLSRRSANSESVTLSDSFEDLQLPLFMASDKLSGTSPPFLQEGDYPSVT